MCVSTVPVLIQVLSRHASRSKSSSLHCLFWHMQYMGLWHEAEGNADAARESMVAAVGTPYAEESGDYMASLARVHCQQRGWLVI
jgi:hypothetical protein